MRQVRLGDISKINPRGPKTGDFAGDAAFDFVPMAAVSENGSMAVESRRQFAEVSKGYTAFKNGDVLLAKITPCYENNKIAVAAIGTEYGFGSTEFHVIRCDPAEVCTRYLNYFLRQDSVRYAGERRMTGSGGQRRVPKQFLEELKVPLPPLEEQRRIAAILDQADALRRLRHRTLTHLNTLAQSIFHEMFGDPKINPQGWDREKLGDLCDVGSSARVFVNEFVDAGVPFYRGTEVGKLGTGQHVEPDLFVSPDHYQALIQRSGRPEIGDLLLPSICHDGRIWRVDTAEPFYFKDGRVLWIKSNGSDINAEYLRNHLRNVFLNDYHSIASGTTFAELKIVNLKNLSVLCPPLELQAEFSSRIEELEGRVSAVQQSAEGFDGLFTSLQYRAFRGEL